MKRTLYGVIGLIALVAMLLSSCQAPEPVAVPTIAPTDTPVKATEPPAAEEPTAAPQEPTAAPQEPTAEPQEPTAAPAMALESPMLAERVAAGQLPPLEERLPLVPLVVKDGMISAKGAIPDFSVGKYGGTMRTTHVGGFSVPFFYIQVEPLITGPGISLEGAYPNVLQEYSVSDDFTTFTFKLRQGLKWSDGEPVTMDDIKFVFEDLYFNDKYMPNKEAWLLSPDEAKTLVEFDVVDDWTFRLTYTAPKGSLIMDIALVGWNSWELMLRPKHFLMKFHPTYADQAELDAALQQAGLKAEEWPTLLDNNTCSRWDMGVMAERCKGYPVLSPYILVELTQEAASWERNPYYFKVDEAGQQLPYIDSWVSVFTADQQTSQTIALGGEVDILSEVDLLKAALFMERGKAIGFDLNMGTSFHADGITFFISSCPNDPVLRTLFNDLRFRQALNFAINREEINDNIYLGFGKLPDWVMPSEYSPEQANALLDEIGMTERDADGYRLSPEGKPVSILVENNTGAYVSGKEKAGELFIEHLKAVGIKADLRLTDAGVLLEEFAAKDTQITVYVTFTPTDPDGMETSRPGGGYWCANWTWLKSSGEPRPDYLPQEAEDYYWAILERTKYEPHSPQDQQLYKLIQKFYREGYWALISVGAIPAPIWINGQLGNITTTGIQAGALRALEVAYFKK